ncbi:MAG: DUF378 domain-containing protein [Bacillota bacterium]|jgi:uncharacterized membrane protein YuzA (DUF378 family)
MDTLALVLVIIGALNWGLIGLFNLDLVATLFGGQDATLSRIVYSLVGLAGLWSINFLFRRNAVTGSDDRMME